jgi:hypothetical protein
MLLRVERSLQLLVCLELDKRNESLVVSRHEYIHDWPKFRKVPVQGRLIQPCRAAAFVSDH